jgi:hypothetical protein
MKKRSYQTKIIYAEIDEKIVDSLSSYCESTKITKTVVISEAIKQYLKGGRDEQH